MRHGHVRGDEHRSSGRQLSRCSPTTERERTTPDLSQDRRRLTIHFTEKSVPSISPVSTSGRAEFGGGDADGGSVSIV